MSDSLSSPKSVIQIGDTAYRLPGRYDRVFLMPPDYRTYVAADSATREYREYDLTTGLPLRTILGPDQYGTVSRPSADGTRIATHRRGGIQIINRADRRVVFSLPDEPENVWFTLAPTGDRLAALIRNPDTAQREADLDLEGVYVRMVVVHDVGSTPGQREFRPLANYGVIASFSPDGCLLAVSGEWQCEYDDQPAPFDGSEIIQIWDVATEKEVFRLVPPEEALNAYVVFGGGLLLINSIHYNRPFGVYDLSTGKLVCKFSTHYPHLEQAVLSSDGNLLVGVHNTGDLVRWNPRTGKPVDVTKCPFHNPSSLSGVYDVYTKDIAFRADKTVLVLRVVEQAVEVWTAPDGIPITRLLGGTAPITAIGFADGGMEIRTASRGDAVVRRWDTRTGKLLGEIRLPKAVARCCLGHIWFGPADTLIAWSADGFVVFKLSTKEIRLTPRTYEEAILDLSLSADGWLVSLPTHYLNETDVGVRIEHVVDGGPRELYRFDSTSATVAYDRGRVLLVYDDRQDEQRTAVCLRVTHQRAKVLWSRVLPIGPEYKKSYRSGIDFSRVNSCLSDSTVVWAVDGLTALVIPAKERVPFLIDTTTGDILSTWTTAIGRPLAVHPTRPVLATTTADGDALILADWRTGTRLAMIQEQSYPHALAWSPDGHRLAASLSDGTARVFELDAV